MLVKDLQKYKHQRTSDFWAIGKAIANQTTEGTVETEGNGTPAHLNLNRQAGPEVPR